ncbi:MAG: DUF5320 domain-containing protein [Acetomicrobium sp.]
MPRGDRTGPAGMGAMTGRAAGYCAGYPVPGYMNPYWCRGAGFRGGLRRGWGAGFGRGRGWRRMYYANGLPGWARAYYPYYHGWMAPYPEEIPQDVAAAEEETAFLKQQAELLKSELKAIEKRLEELSCVKGEEAEGDK